MPAAPSPSSADPAARRATRTQEERRAETRTKLLEATVRSIAEAGLAATTSRRICELAGVSSGAQTHHFPKRSDLLGAAVEHLASQRIEELRLAAPGLPQDRARRLARLLDILWEDFSSPAFVVFVQLWVAAQDDPELHARLVPVERQLAEAMASLSTLIVGEVDRELQDRMFVVVNAVRGLALTEHYEPRTGRHRDPWPRMRRTLLALLASY